MQSEAKMSSIKQPVVWCSDPNSTNQKPTAFALQGIQFEGMITEQHVLALRELINAAAEGRLLLPSNGAIVLLDCGIDVNSNADGQQQQQQQQLKSIPATQSNTSNETLPVTSLLSSLTSAVKTKSAEPSSVQSNEQILTTIPIDVDTCADANDSIDTKHSIDQSKQIDHATATAIDSTTVQLEPKYSEFEMPKLSKYDFIYEFLCCAKCINTEQTQKPHDHGVGIGVGVNKSCQRKVVACGHNHGFIYNVEKNMCHLTIDSRNHVPVPIYATVNTKIRKQNIFAHPSNLIKSQSNTNAFESKNLVNLNRKECESVDKTDNCAVDSHGKNDNETVMKQVPIDDEMQSSTLGAEANELPDTDLNHIQLQATNSKNSSRKTSLDSSCTIGSMDSGFIEMQNKLDMCAKENASQNSNLVENVVPTITITPDDEIAENESAVTNQLEPHKDNVMLKECSTQSRNRRKSYEEFKAIYHNRMTLESELPFVEEQHEHTLPVCNKKEKIKARRKSYEEFKALVRECGDDVNESKRKKSKQYAKTNAKTLSTMDENAMVYLNEKNEMKTKQNDMTSNVENVDKKCDVLATTTTVPRTIKTKNEIYKTNFKIYDKLISYGTIYDIMQKKTDIYKAYRKYDAYMTYGTIYEILQRKSDDNELFRRTRANSEKFINKRINGKSSDTSDKQTMANENKATAETLTVTTTETVTSTNSGNKDDKSRSLNFGAIYDIIQRKHRQSKKSNSLPNGVIGAIEMAKMSDAECKANRKNRASDGCIYDIIQSKQCDLIKAQSMPITTKTIATTTTDHAQPNVINNRFLVEKVNENELSHTKSIDSIQTTGSSINDETKGNTYNEPEMDAISPVISSSSFLGKWNSPRLSKAKKSNRMRRFSHILSYTQRNTQSDANATTVDVTSNPLKLLPYNESLPQTIDEHTDATDEIVSAANSNGTVNRDAQLDQQQQQQQSIVGHRKEVRVKKMNKLRKMSSPLPLSQADQPPKIRPRKQSVPPPPLPPSFHLLTQHNVKSNDSCTILAHNDPAKRHNEIDNDIDHVTCNDNNNNNHSSKNENNNNSNEHNTQNENRSDGGKCKAINLISDGKLLKTTKQKIPNKSNLIETKPMVKRSTARIVKKAKSRRLSEFTRGEFLNEKP